MRKEGMSRIIISPEKEKILYVINEIYHAILVITGPYL